MNEQQFQDIADDVNLELVKFGEVQEYWIVKPYQATIGSKLKRDIRRTFNTKLLILKILLQYITTK